MHVSIVKEWLDPENQERFRRTDPKNPLFYICRLQKGRQRYLKIGTTERGIGARFGGADYKKYSHIKMLYVAEVSSDKNPADACYHVEDLTRSAIREMKGFTFIKNDRFQYFQLPPAIPVCTSFNERRMVSL